MIKADVLKVTLKIDKNALVISNPPFDKNFPELPYQFMQKVVGNARSFLLLIRKKDQQLLSDLVNLKWDSNKYFRTNDVAMPTNRAPHTQFSQTPMVICFAIIPHFV